MAGIVIYKPTRDLYNGVIKATKGVGSGIAAQKTGYHDSRNNNPRGNYSVVLPLDKQGPGDGAAAIDITLSDASMKKFTKMLMQGLDNKDPRLKAIKEVIGTIDGRNVVRYTRDSSTSRPRWASSDKSHLWHIHISLFRAYINNWSVLKGIVDFLNGIDSDSGSENGVALPKLNDKNEDVKYWQGILDLLGYPLKQDGEFGPKMKAALTKWHGDYLKRNGSTAKAYNGSLVTGSVARELQMEYTAKRLGITPDKDLSALGDTGSEVGYWKRILVKLGYTVNLKNEEFDAEMATALSKWHGDYLKRKGSTDRPYNGRAVTGSVALELQKEFIAKTESV